MDVIEESLPLDITRLLGFSVPSLVTRLCWPRASSPVRSIRLPARSRLRTCGIGRSTESRRTARRIRHLPLSVAREALINSLCTDIIHARDLAFLDTRRIFILFRLRITVEVQIHHDIPFCLAVRKRPAQTEHLARQHPPDQPNSMTPLVIRRDGDIDILGRRIGIAERNDRDIDIRRFLDGLCVGARVRDNDQAGLFERARDVVGEVAWGEASRDGGGAGVGGKFENGALAVGAGGDDGDVGGVVDCGDDAGC